MPGAAWRVLAGGTTLSRGAAGIACSLPSRVLADEETPYDLASLTKPLATALVAVLLERSGTIDPDAPVRGLLPEWSSSPYGDATITDLAAHRSGLPAWRPLYLDASSAEGYLARIAVEPPAAPPGTTLYSDLGYLSLGVALERAAGEPLDRLFDRCVARPLGLRRTGFAGGTERFRDAAATEQGNAYERGMAGAAGEGYAWREEIIRGEPHDGNARALGGVAGNAGLFGTASEVGAIGAEILEPRRLPLDRRARERLLRRVAGAGTRTFGFVPASESFAARGVLPDDAPGHTGFTGTSLWLDPERGGVYVLLTNRVHPRIPADDFQPVRREFHRVAVRIATS